MKLFLLISMIFLSIFAKEITPYKYITASDAVSDFVKVNDTLIIGTEEGIIDIYDLKKDKMVDKIILEKQINIFNDEMGILIISVDYLDSKLVFLTRRLNTWGDLYIYENKKLTKLIDNSQHITLQKVAFVNKDLVIISTMGNELMLFSIKDKKFIYKKQLNLASFSDFTLSEDKKYIFTSDETPLIYKIEILSGKIVKEYKKANKRDIFSIDYKNNLLLSGGKDKRIILYKSPTNFKYIKADFFVYTVALNSDATLAAFDKNEENDISIIDTKTLEELYLLKGHNQTTIKIDFYKQNELISADEDNKLMFWKLD